MLVVLSLYLHYSFPKVSPDSNPENSRVIIGVIRYVKRIYSNVADGSRYNTAWQYAVVVRCKYFVVSILI